MIKNICIFFLLLITAPLLKAQDLIVKKSGETIEGKVIETKNNQVKFRKKDNPDGPVYILNISDLSMVKYEDGKTKFLNTTTTLVTQPDKPVKKVEYGNNFFSYHLFDIVFNDFTLSYEKLINDGTMGIQIPIGIGFNYNETYAYGDYSNKFYTGLGINFYPTGQGQWRYFVGPSFRVGAGYTKVYTVGVAPLFESTAELKDFTYAKLFVNNGIMYSPVPNLSISAVGSLGIKYFDRNLDDYTQKGVYNAAHFSVIMGYRF